MDDNSRRLGGLFWKLNEGQVAQHVMAKLMQMCAALDAGNWPAAQHIQVCGTLPGCVMSCVGGGALVGLVPACLTCWVLFSGGLWQSWWDLHLMIVVP